MGQSSGQGAPGGIPGTGISIYPISSLCDALTSDRISRTMQESKRTVSRIKRTGNHIDWLAPKITMKAVQLAYTALPRYLPQL